DFGYTGGQLTGPEKIVAYSKDTFYVCDAGNDRIVVYDSYGNYSRRMTDQSWKYPIALAFDGPNLFWLLDRETGTFSLYRTDGMHLRTFGPQLMGSSESLLNPSDLVVLPGNRLLIADSGSNRLLLCRIIYGQK
ncbi:MAG TPA: hypothetical protein VMS71_07610, partial [Candidatus Acidoferrum sp.]|nr:hypothetical protein [Candidatus Acidoferrum sp.]